MDYKLAWWLGRAQGTIEIGFQPEPGRDGLKPARQAQRSAIKMKTTYSLILMMSSAAILTWGVLAAETNTTVTVTVKGEVQWERTVQLTNPPPHTLGQVLAIVGKPSIWANERKVRVIRLTTDRVQVTNIVDCSTWRTGTVESITFPLHGGDEVYVPARRISGW